MEIKKIGDCLLLHVISVPGIMPLYLRGEASLVGYEVGFFGEEKTVYSSIFNEILFGTVGELTFFKNLLNEHLLFPDRIVCENYICLHRELSIQGKDVEDFGEMIIYEIWNQKGSCYFNSLKSRASGI